MSDLIKRSDAIKAVWGDDINPSEDGMVFEAQSHIDRDMRLIPSADRPQGEWIPCTKRGLPLTELGRRERQEWYGYKCSKCNFIYKGNALTESPFCQNCGADMKGMDDVV